jgi:hypothetical protein
MEWPNLPQGSVKIRRGNFDCYYRCKNGKPTRLLQIRYPPTHEPDWKTKVAFIPLPPPEYKKIEGEKSPPQVAPPKKCRGRPSSRTSDALPIKKSIAKPKKTKLFRKGGRFAKKTPKRAPKRPTCPDCHKRLSAKEHVCPGKLQDVACPLCNKLFSPLYLNLHLKEYCGVFCPWGRRNDGVRLCPYCRNRYASKRKEFHFRYQCPAFRPPNFPNSQYFYNTLDTSFWAEFKRDSNYNLYTQTNFYAVVVAMCIHKGELWVAISDRSRDVRQGRFIVCVIMPTSERSDGSEFLPFLALPPGFILRGHRLLIAKDTFCSRSVSYFYGKLDVAAFACWLPTSLPREPVYKTSRTFTFVDVDKIRLDNMRRFSRELFPDAKSTLAPPSHSSKATAGKFPPSLAETSPFVSETRPLRSLFIPRYHEKTEEPQKKVDEVSKWLKTLNDLPKHTHHPVPADFDIIS